MPPRTNAAPLCRTLAAIAAGVIVPMPLMAASAGAAAKFHGEIRPLLEKYCFDCHGGGINKGKVTLDEFASDAAMLGQHDLWLAALKNVRAGLMPPREDGAPRPTSAEIATLERWIKHDAFGIDPRNPDPGHVIARRLNRTEYRNTIRDLLGYDFNAEAEFPADDTGHGFDNLGEVLTLSPLHLEKYLQAAESIVDKAVPKVSSLMRERAATGRDFRATEGGGNGENLNARRATTVERTFRVDQAEKYRVVIELETRGSFDFDAGRCDLICRIDGREVSREEVVWAERRTIRHEHDVVWAVGAHTVSFEVLPRGEVATNKEAVVAAAEARVRAARPGSTSVTMRVVSVQVRGPIDPKFWITPDNYARFFPKGPAPADAAGRDRYAAELLKDFATRAYRRPVDARTVERLGGLARQVYGQPGKTFEEGIGRAMMAVLGSPRFIFRVEAPEPGAKGPFGLIDEHALASRLSYFLWSTMPDEELFRLADRGELRRQLKPQVARMLADPKAKAFTRNFTGQWLQARDIETVPINMRVVLGPDAPRNRDGRIEFDGTLRRLMRSETEMYFEHIIREDRSVLELIESDYTFLNERLAQIYGVPGVSGDELRLVKLEPGSPRGGVLTHGSVLGVTSNPTRTSPVKRGLFILENILGTPPPPPPPDVPDLEESKKEFGGREPRLSEMLALHREKPLCFSCHARMDPLGLALENFNALGGWREKEAGQGIDPSGELVTGEKFASVPELKRVLAHERTADFYRCLSEKLLTYALGRGLGHLDVHAVDEIAGRLAREGGRMSALISGVIESVPFQKQRVQSPLKTASIPPVPASPLNPENRP
ncbi:MAG: DUF1592 domain-containing protein [Opitutaceae bacterium]|nr:DUF1592 domain-containing protein [Opitutaceae bacterium]